MTNSLVRMARRTARALGTVAVMACLLVAVSAAEPAPVPRIPVVDLSVDLLQRTLNGRAPFLASRGQATPRRLRLGAVEGVVLGLHEPRRGAPLDVPAETAFQALEHWLSRPGDFRAPGCGEMSDGIRTWLALDGAAELGREPAKAGLWVTRGVRIFRLVSDEDNELATAWTSPPPGPVVGLTALGREVVRRIYAAGGVVDVATGSAPTRDDVFAMARQFGAPVMAVSSNARAEADDPRNLTDSELLAVADSGGVIAISFDGHRLARGREANVRDVIRHVEHIERVAGIDHIAIGSGYEGVRPPDGLETASDFPRLARALLGAGMTEDEVERVFHRNALRLLCPTRTLGTP